jgi:hypothetical protein
MTSEQSSADTAHKTEHLRHEYDPTETNWAKLTFPADPSGLTVKLRREFRDAVQRCRGADDKFRQVLDNLEVLMAWGQAKLEADKIANQRSAEVAAARVQQAEREEAFRERIQAGPTIRVSATSTGFIEESVRTGAVLAVYDTAEAAAEPVAAMAQAMIAEGRNPNSVLVIDAFGRPAIGSGQTLGHLAAYGTEISAPVVEGGLQGLRFQS